MVVEFASLQELYEDMINHCKNFTFGISGDDTKGYTSFYGEVVFSNFEFRDCNFESGNNELQFWQSGKIDGANLYLHNVVKGKRVGDPQTDSMFEYQFRLNGRENPFVLLSCGWR